MSKIILNILIVLSTNLIFLSAIAENKVNSNDKVAVKNSKALEFFNIGKKLHLQFTIKDYQEAIKMYDKALSLDKKFAEALAAKAESQALLAFEFKHRQKNYKNLLLQSELLSKAYENAFIASELNPELSEVHKAFSLIYNLQDQVIRSREEAQKAIELDPNDPEAFFMLWINSGIFPDVQNTRKDLEINPDDSNIKKALELDPSFVIAHIMLGRIYIFRGDYDKAIESFKIVLENSPSNSDAFNGLGVIYQKLNKLDDAIFNYEEALKINPEDPETHHNIGDAYFNKWNLEKSSEHHKQGCSLGNIASCNWLETHGYYGIAKPNQKPFHSILEKS